MLFEIVARSLRKAARAIFLLQRLILFHASSTITVVLRSLTKPATTTRGSMIADSMTVFPAAVTTTPRTGNFKPSEDVLLASAYALVTADASVGTDQDANTFWSKIRDHFVRHGGLALRSVTSLKNRFNKVLQAEVNKYLGNMHTVLREFHSGWSIADYVRKAKNLFLVKNGKQFKHEEVWEVLRKKLPKFEIDLGNIDSRTARAIFLLDSDVTMNDEELVTSDCTGTISDEDTMNVAGRGTCVQSQQ